MNSQLFAAYSQAHTEECAHTVTARWMIHVRSRIVKATYEGLLGELQVKGGWSSCHHPIEAPEPLKSRNERSSLAGVMKDTTCVSRNLPGNTYGTTSLRASITRISCFPQECKLTSGKTQCSSAQFSPAAVKHFTWGPPA